MKKRPILTEIIRAIKKEHYTLFFKRNTYKKPNPRMAKIKKPETNHTDGQVNVSLIAVGRVIFSKNRDIHVYPLLTE